MGMFCSCSGHAVFSQPGRDMILDSGRELCIHPSGSIQGREGDRQGSGHAVFSQPGLDMILDSGAELCIHPSGSILDWGWRGSHVSTAPKHNIIQGHWWGKHFLIHTRSFFLFFFSLLFFFFFFYIFLFICLFIFYLFFFLPRNFFITVQLLKTPLSFFLFFLVWNVE